MRMSVQSVGGTQRRASPHISRCATICAVPGSAASNVWGGAVHTVPGGRQAITIGEMPGFSTAGLLDFGSAGHGNIAATTSCPTATWIVAPFCAGVTVTVPWAVLGGLVGGRDEGFVDGGEE